MLNEPQTAEQKKPRAGGIAADQLRAVVERIERLEEEKAGLTSDIKDIFAEAKGNGYDVKTLRKVLRLRKQDAAERDEEEFLLDTYLSALGMAPQMDLFEDAQEETPPENQPPVDEAALYEAAVDVVVRDNNASTSYLQRRLGVGYNRAARLIDRMETEGIVSSANHVGKREVSRTPG